MLTAMPLPSTIPNGRVALEPVAAVGAEIGYRLSTGLRRCLFRDGTRLDDVAAGDPSRQPMASEQNVLPRTKQSLSLLYYETHE